MKQQPTLTAAMMTVMTILLGPAVLARAAGPVDAALVEQWRAGGDEGVVLGVVAGIEIDPAGRVYVLDRQLCEVQIFGPDGEHLGTVGREGEGPGEFRAPGDLVVTPDGNIGVMMGMPGRIVVLSPAGEPLDDLPLPAGENGGVLTLGGVEYRGGNLVIYRFEREFTEHYVDQNIFLQRIDPGSRDGIRYHRMFVRDVPNEMVLDETERGEVLQRWGVGPDGRVWLAEGYTEYLLRVWNPDGTVDRTFTRDVEPRRRSAARIAERTDLIKSFTRNWPGETEIRVSDFDITVRDFHVLPDGGCWVLTSRGLHDRPEGSLGVWDVFDAAGDFTHQVSLVGEGDPERDAIYLRGDTVLVVRGALDSRLSRAGGAVGAAASGGEETPLEIVCYRLEFSNGKVR